MTNKTTLVRYGQASLVVAGVPGLIIGWPRPADANQRTVTDEATEQQVTIVNEGDCPDLEVEVLGMSSSDPEDSAVGIDYTVDNACNVTVHEGAAGLPPPPAGDELDSTESGAPADQAEFATLAVWRGNWVHTSQTLQDIFNIDITKFRFHTDRIWNGDVTKFSGAWYARSEAPRSWNHTSGAPFLNYMQSGQAASRTAKASGRFHSDFLWCNFEPGQNFTMSTEITTYKDGGYSRKYSQNRQCAGTHKATRSWTSTTPPAEWCRLYPNGKGC